VGRALRIAGKAALGAAAFAVTGKLITSGLQPESQLYGRTLIRGADPDEWALTYDDGPNPRSTPELLDVLARFEARATFFMIGKFIREQRDLVRRVHAAGHIVGNHTMTHPFLATKPMELVRDEIDECTALLEDTLGSAVRFFRAPYGARRPGILRFVRERGLVPVQWNAQGNDWEPIGVHGILEHMNVGLARARQRRRGANLLLHDGFDEQQGFDRGDTVRATESLLRHARENGIRMVGVDAWAS
jgi:peptidoglycan-N-acetylglucosamine deacetylase